MNVWSEFQSLKSVILGKLFDTDDLLSYLSLSSKWEQHFKLINDQGIQELELISNCLQSLGVEVYRPHTYKINSVDGGAGPPLSPRDWFLTYGNKTIVGNDAFANHNVRTTSTNFLLKEHIKIPHDEWATVTFNDLKDDTLARPYFHTANILRCGQDIFITKDLGRTGNTLGRDFILKELTSINPKVRFHDIDCEEHLDGYIFFVRPGLLLSRISKDNLPAYFKNWDIVYVDEQFEVYNKVLNYKWKKLNPVVAKEYAWFLQTNPEETLFSLNGLSIDESTVVFPGKSKTIFNSLEKFGVNCISVDMRAISYWDSGLHCCTSEIHREGDLEDYS